MTLVKYYAHFVDEETEAYKVSSCFRFFLVREKAGRRFRFSFFIVTTMSSVACLSGPSASYIPLSVTESGQTEKIGVSTGQRAEWSPLFHRGLNSLPPEPGLIQSAWNTEA